MSIHSASTAPVGPTHSTATRASLSTETASSGAGVQAESEALPSVDVHLEIDSADQLKLSRNLLLGNFTGMTTVQVQALKLADPTAGAGRPESQVQLPHSAWSNRSAEPKRGLFGRLRDAFDGAMKRLARPTAQRANFDTNPELRLTAIRSSPKLQAGFAKACEERFCKDELFAFDAAEEFLAHPDKRAFLAMTFVASKVNLPDDLLRRLERQQAAADQPLPFNQPAAVRLAEEVRANLKSLLSDNIIQDPKLRGKHGLDDATLLAELHKRNLAAG